MRLLERVAALRSGTDKVARRRRVSFLRSWVTWSPRRAQGTMFAVLAVVGVAVMVGVVRTSVWVQEAKYQSDLSAYEESLVTPTDAPQMQVDPLEPDAPAGAPTGSVDVPAPVITPDPLSATSLPVLVDPKAQVTAQKFMGAWLAGRTAKNQAAWLASLKPVTDPALFVLFGATDRSLIPAVKVTKTTTTVKPDNRALTTFTMSDGSVIGVGTVKTATGWAATDISPAD